MRFVYAQLISLLIPLVALGQGALVGGTLVGGKITSSGGTTSSGGFACNDGLDNDGDGIADYPGDMGCTSPYDQDESGDNTVIVGADITSNQLISCINGTDIGTNGSICNNVSGSKLTNTTVIGCSSSLNGTSTCASTTLRTMTTSAYQGHFSNTAYNYIKFNDFNDPSCAASNPGAGFCMANMRLVHGELHAQGQYPGGGMEFWSQATGSVIDNSYVDGGQNGVASNFPNSVPANYCKDNQIVTGATNLRITNNVIYHFCPGDGSSNQSHAEAFWVDSGATGMHIEGNQFYENGGTGHIFFTDGGTVGNFAQNVCVTNNGFGLRLGNVDMAERTGTSDGFTTSIYFDPSNHTLGSTTTPIPLGAHSGGLVYQNVGVAQPRTCQQCNDGIDNDGDGKIDYWPDGLGDSGCSGFNDNSE